MEIGLRLSLHDVGHAFDVILYQHEVGCLIYLCITQPDVQFVIFQMSRFMHFLGVKHWQEINY